MDFAGKSILITGSSRGIGKATARAFLDLGARVAINGRNEQSVSKAISELGDGDNLIPAPGDIGTVAGCYAVVEAAIDGLGGLDVLVNCAGVDSIVTIEQCDEAHWDKILDINLKGTFFCSQAALPALRENGGCIVNLASDAGFLGYASATVYCASKAGVLNLTRAMAMELIRQVRVNCVCPGWVDTDMAQEYIDAADDPDSARQELENFSPMKRMARPEEIAMAIIYLASGDAGFITGVGLPIDGGETAGR